jgi:hypothetical protein
MKHMVLVTLSLSIALTVLSLTGCDDGNTTTGETHTHTYSTTYSYNATQHWRECTANDGAKSEVANHSGDPCAVCDYYSGANPDKTIFSIKAAYASTNPIFPDTPLDTLKAGLTVTAWYMDNNRATLDAADYTLSGTLTTGVSVVTVTCEGKTANFTVNVYPLHEHQWSKIGEAPPTCTAPGREFWRCSASPPHNESRDGGAAALGHDEGAWYTTIPATCTETGTRELLCTRDYARLNTGTVAIDPDAHDYGNWTETTAPTCTTAGEDTRTCAHDVTHTDTRHLRAGRHRNRHLQA